MSETQLREAYTLMKQGDKQGAARLVQNVLKEDRSNIQAWWLFSHVLDDEDKIVKSLEKVLALNPEHPGARKRLAQLRPEYAHLAAVAEPKAKTKTEQQSGAYWSKLDNEHKIREQAYTKHIVKKSLGSIFGVRLMIFIIAAPFMIAYAIYFNFNNQQNLHDKNGDTPLTIGAIYLEAIYREDFETLYAIACPEYYPEIEAMEADDSDYQPSEITVDMSETEFSIFYQNGNKAFVQVEGVTVITYPGSDFTIDWDADAEFEDIDVYGEHFTKSADDVWQVCVDFYVPDLDMRDEE
jgi:hypothetical protein